MVKKGRNLGRVVWPSATTGPLPRHTEKIGRNDRCPCGSGKKYKDCHEKDGSFLKRLAREHEKEHRREVRASLKSQGVPWWKRLFLTR